MLLNAGGWPDVEDVTVGANLVLCSDGSNEDENGQIDELRYIMNG